jgi:hypothetical protein
VPRAVIVVSRDPNLFEHVQDVLRPDPRFIISDGIHCDGSVVPLTNIYPIAMAALEWDDWEADGDRMPDPRTMSTLIFETGSSTWVAEVGKLLAGGLEALVWFVDSSGTAWPADLVDPDRIALS